MRPVVFVPGLPGSHLKKGDDIFFLDIDDLLLRRAEILPDLKGPDDLSDRTVVPAHPIRSAGRFLFFEVAKQAQSLYDILDSLGYDTAGANALFEPVGWDWRKPVDDELAHSSLRSAILRLEGAAGRKPVAIVHSTGGLVFRALLEAEPELADHLDRVIAFGVPWAGTLRTLPYLIAHEGFGPAPAEYTQEVMAHSWAAFDLLPPAAANNQLGFTLDETGSPVDILMRRSWFADALRPAMARRADHSVALHRGRTPEIRLGGRSLPITNIVGFGAATLLRARLAADGTIAPPEKEKNDRALDDGDGTVPRRSAAWLAGADVHTFHLPVGFYPGQALSHDHNMIWSNPGSQDLLGSLLADRPGGPFVHFALDGEDVNAPADTLRLRGATFDPMGSPLREVEAEFSGLVGASAEKIAENRGRSLFTFPRTAVRKTDDSRFRRFTIKVSWSGGQIEERSYLIRP